MSAAIYTLEQLSFSYPSVAKHRAKSIAKNALKHLSLDIQANDFVGIIGPNGAGKSSLLQLLNGSALPTTGSLLLAGRPTYRATAKQLAKRVATVAQMSAPPIGLSCFQVAAMGLLPHKRWFEADTDTDRQQVQLALTQVGLADKQQDSTATLSGGELQRLFIARALVQQAGILLLDEPTNHLDIQYQHQVLQLLQRLGKTVVCCIHDLNLAARYCNKLMLLNQGELVAYGAPAEVLKPDLLEQVFGLPCEVLPHSRFGWLQVTFFSAQDTQQSAGCGGVL
ncbi:ABC transporter [Alishewanella longhuensis]|uniref:ABC transporter n=1 Tax=Alishewanella longhuensis TaxID=1091037 RepID=A0ABQ3KZQ5_9ALTE|nr:ABC transporter ATP-binding protein [Alishewanella longhuensis]GHG71644.1 ABC transporter [Alishewanella longhuensis]